MWVHYQGRERQARQLLGSSGDCSYYEVSVVWTWKVEAAEAGQQRQRSWSDKSFALAQHSSRTGHLAKACSQPALGTSSLFSKVIQVRNGIGILRYSARRLGNCIFLQYVIWIHPALGIKFRVHIHVVFSSPQTPWCFLELKVFYGFPSVAFRHFKVPAFSRGFTEKLKRVIHEKLQLKNNDRPYL